MHRRGRAEQTTTSTSRDFPQLALVIIVGVLVCACVCVYVSKSMFKLLLLSARRAFAKCARVSVLYMSIEKAIGS